MINVTVTIQTVNKQVLYDILIQVCPGLVNNKTKRYADLAKLYTAITTGTIEDVGTVLLAITAYCVTPSVGVY